MDDPIAALRAVVGSRGFVTDPDKIDSLLVDERKLYRGRAAAIVQPGSTREVADCVSICHRSGIGMVPQGGNTSYCGGATPDESGRQVLINLTRLKRVRGVDELGFTLTIEAGASLAAAQACANDHGMLLPLSMGSQGSCQIGGNLSTNAGGLAVLRYGTARDLVLGLEVVLPDGRIWDGLSALRKDNTGYDLKQLFLGAEGTLGIITAAVLKLFPIPQARSTAWLALPSLAAAGEILAMLKRRLGDCVVSFEYVSGDSMHYVGTQVNGVQVPFADPHRHFALIETIASGPDTLASQVEGVLESALANGSLSDAVVAQNESQRRAFWRLRESIPEAEKRMGGSIKHDVSVAIAAIPRFVDAASTGILERYPNVRLSVYGHVGDGNVHFNVLAPVAVDPGRFRFDNAEAVSDYIHRMAGEFSGSFSAEHGIGRLKRAALQALADPLSIELMQRIKTALDPQGLMNPGKVL